MPDIVLLRATAADLALSTSFATIATIMCWAPSSSYPTNADSALSTIFATITCLALSSSFIVAMGLA